MRIEAQNLTKRFGRTTALDAVSLDIPSGRRVGLVGPNGSGKSTLTRALVGLIAVEGELRLDGLGPRRDRTALAPRLAYVPQTPPSLAAPVGELVIAVSALRSLSHERVAATAAELDLDIGSIAARPFRNLSGGMKQKLLIALALATDASLLVMDEPTASLDAPTRDRFFRLYERVAVGRTVVLCSHRIEEMRHMIDHVVALEDGHARYAGPADAYLAGRAMCVIQALQRDTADGVWLADLGFQRGTGGWWQKTVDQIEKVSLLPRLAPKLGGELANLHVKDLETIAVEKTS